MLTIPSVKNTPSLPGFLDLPSYDQIVVNEESYSIKHINNEIRNIIDSRNSNCSGIYIHASNSASLRAFDDDQGLLSIHELKKREILVESGEQTHPDFRNVSEYEHNVVYLTKFSEIGINPEAGTYMSYNVDDTRYPVLYVIEDTDNKVTMENSSNYTILNVRPEQIRGLLVPENKIQETRDRLPEFYRDIIISPLN